MPKCAVLYSFIPKRLYQCRKLPKVILLPEKTSRDSMFRVKAFRQELVAGIKRVPSSKFLYEAHFISFVSIIAATSGAESLNCRI